MDGHHRYPRKRKATASLSASEPPLFEMNDVLKQVTDINIEDISDDEWSDE